MKRFLIGAFVAVSLFAFVSAANAQNVNGIALIQVAGGATFPAQSFRVKFCKIDNNGNPIPGACSPTSNPTLLNGFFGFNVQHGAGWYYMFLWRESIFWGSEEYPANGPFFIGNFPGGNTINGVFSRPRAGKPGAVNPANNSVNRPTSFTLQWTDGLDPNRRDPNWVVTYDIYASGNEFPETLVFSNIPCNGFGTCSVNVSGLVYSTRYQWRVVARMRSPIIFPVYGDNLYLTDSDTFRFSTMFDPSTPTYSFRTSNNNRYLTAPGGGGGDFTATASNIDSLTSQFKIIDVNGGSLMSGDTVHVQTNRNYYLMAFNAGGGDVATSGWAQSWETFTIMKVGGSGSISGGDSIALRGPNGFHYVSAVNGGGGTVNCSAAAIGAFETFTLVQQ